MRLPLVLVLLAANFYIIRAQISTFDTGNEGWRCDGDPQSNSAFWNLTGGNPGGHIRMTDGSTGGTWYFVAPAKFLGSKCDAYGKFLRYDQFADNHSNPNAFADIELIGGGIRLVFDHPILPFPTWTHYDLFLREDAGWRVNTTNGLVPTQAQFKQVLSNITSLRIRGEFHHFAVDYGGLDNVLLESNFAFDLDADNSSGLSNGDYRADTSCFPSLLVVGNDPVLTSEGPIDSLVIRLLNGFPSESITLPNIPPPLLVVVYGPHHITLVNPGNGGTLDFLAAIQLLGFQDGSLHPLQGTRQVEFKVYAGCGLAATQRSFLPVYPPPSAGIPGDTTVCVTGAPFPLFSVLKGFPDPGGAWMPATSIAGGVFDPATDSAGVYAYIFAPAGECAGDTSWVTVELETPPVLRPDTTICFDEVLFLERPRELLEWEWDNGSQQSEIAVSAPGIYSLSGRTEYCLFSDSVQVDFYSCKACDLYVPNVFTPNGDGQNDQWQAFLPCRWQRFRLEVYDRWGSLVFAAENPEQTWDGQTRGRESMTGVYVWRLEWDADLFGQVQTWRAKGDVTILR
jgi:gliding motility-associated-like protein